MRRKLEKNVLEAVKNWAQDKDGLPVCWLYGPAGSGKSVVAHTIAEERDMLGKNLALVTSFPGGIKIATT